MCRDGQQQTKHLLDRKLLVLVDLRQGGLQQAVVVWLAEGKGQVLQLHNKRVQAQHACQGRKDLRKVSAWLVSCCQVSCCQRHC